MTILFPLRTSRVMRAVPLLGVSYTLSMCTLGRGVNIGVISTESLLRTQKRRGSVVKSARSDGRRLVITLQGSYLEVCIRVFTLARLVNSPLCAAISAPVCRYIGVVAPLNLSRCLALLCFYGFS